MTNRPTPRALANALLRVLLFGVLFVAFQMVLSRLLVALRSDGFVLQTAATLLAALLAGWLLLGVLEQRPPGDLGFRLQRKAWPQMLIGIALGVSGLLFAALLLVAMGGLRYVPRAGTFAGWLSGALRMLAVLLIPAAAEEALFRGYPFQKLVEGLGAVLATVAASVAFAVAHMQNPSVDALALFNIFIAGVMLSVAYLRTRSLWFATGVHVGWNWSMVALADLPVSGLKLYDAPLYDPVDRSPAWLGGGAFGPEAGVVGMLGLLAIVAGIWWLTRKTRWLT